MLGLKLGRSEDWSAVCGRAHAQTGFKMASQTQTFNSSSPSHQWGNLLRTVTRCQSGRSIRNWFELNWKLIELLFLNWTGNWLNYYFWTESNWNSSLNWIIELTFGLELELRCYTFIFILSSYVWMWFEIFVVHFDWCVNWRYFLTCKRKGKELTQEENFSFIIFTSILRICRFNFVFVLCIVYSTCVLHSVNCRPFVFKVTVTGVIIFCSPLLRTWNWSSGAVSGVIPVLHVHLP